VEIRYHCAQRKVHVADPNATILEVSLANQIPHMRECGGNGRCTTCRVRVLDGIRHVSPRTRVEADLAESRGWDDFTRLACQTRVNGDVELECLIRSYAEASHLQVEQLNPETAQDKRLAILFCDMRNFTPFVEANLPYDVVHMLNRFFSTLGEPILLNNGLIYQYVGDEITGLFGVSGDAPPRSCTGAVRAGLGMLEALETLNQQLSEEFGASMAVGIGIHLGTIIAGRIGHPTDQRFGIVGDAVNTASRIEGVNKELGTRLLVSREVLSELPEGTLRTGESTTVSLKGKSDPLDVFEVLGFRIADPTFLVQATLDRLMNAEARFAENFYRRLFEAAPDVRQLFRKDLAVQGQMLTHMLEGVVYATVRPKNLALGLTALGRRHSEYGVTPRHYEIVRPILLECIEEILGDRCTRPVADAWASIIDSTIGLMSRAVRESHPGN